MNPFGWRVMVNRDATSFVRDEVSLYIGRRDERGLYVTKPLVFEMTGPHDDGANIIPEPEPTNIPSELAGVLFEALAYHVLQVNDLPAEILRLRRELTAANKRVDNLIAGIGRLGGQPE